MKKRYQEIIAKIKELISAPGSQVQPWLPAEAPLKSTPSERSLALYDAVINQFAVEKNPRYRRNQQGKGETYCNIFVWDVTRAMGAEIPHWVDHNNKSTDLGKGIELDANDVIQWLQSQGGWKEVDSERAQDLANQGYPVVATWLNPGGIGHIAVVRPGEYSSSQGPTIAQAGETNFNHGTGTDPRSKRVRKPLAPLRNLIIPNIQSLISLLTSRPNTPIPPHPVQHAFQPLG